MAVAATSPRSSVITAKHANPQTYNLYGLRVRSDVALPLAAMRDATDAPPDCEFTLIPSTVLAPIPNGRMIAGLPCHGPCHNGSWVITVHRGDGGTWFWFDTIGTCHVSPDGRRVDVYPLPDYDARVLGFMLTGQIMTFALQLMGYPSLHASAIDIDGAGIAFLGLGGQGKSTLAAVFLHHGATLVSDDVLPLTVRDGAVYGLPSFPMMKVFQQTAHHALHLSTDLPTLTEHVEKRLFSIDDEFSFSQAPVHLRAIYILDRYNPDDTQQNDITVERISGQERLTALLAQASNRAYLQPGENTALISLFARLAAQAPISVLRYPDGFAYQDLVHASVIADIEERR